MRRAGERGEAVSLILDDRGEAVDGDEVIVEEHVLGGCGARHDRGVVDRDEETLVELQFAAVLRKTLRQMDIAGLVFYAADPQQFEIFEIEQRRGTSGVVAP